jgi:pilus assembly protein CpaC
MNRAKDGNVFRHASPARMRRPGGLFLSAQTLGVLAALGLLRLLGGTPRACGDEGDGTPVAGAAAPVIATSVIGLTDCVPSGPDRLPEQAGATANLPCSPCDELEPDSAEAVLLKPFKHALAFADVHCELRELEALLARTPELGRWSDANPQPVVADADPRSRSDDPVDANVEDGSEEEGASENPSENQFAQADIDVDSDPPSVEPTREVAPRPEPEIRTNDVIANVSILSDGAQRILIGKNTSAAIDLKTDCDRAEIADPGVADIMVVSPRRIVVSGKAFGTTQMILRVGKQQRVFNVAVEHDLNLLTNVIHTTAPTANVQPRSVNGTIILSGTVPDVQTGDRIAETASLFQGGQVRNQLTVAGVQQTLLRVVVAEVNKEAIRQLGFNWAVGGSDWSKDFFFANNVGGINPTVFSSNGLPDVRTGQMTYSVSPTANIPPTNVTFGFPRAEFQVFMNALRQNSLARVLAEPNLVAISGQTATFLAGGEVPVPVTQGGAVAGSITIEYKEFGVRLAFTPTVLGGQIIRLHVMSEVSDAIPGDTIAGGLPVFSFTTRRVESTIECGNGQTFAMAGLLNETVRAVARKLPGLGDVPVLGALFSSVDYKKDNTEMVVLVTPQLVEPLDPQQVPPPPGALMTEPNDYELFALGQMEGTPHEAPEFEGVPREMAPVNMPPRSKGAKPVKTALRGPWGIAEADEN